MKKLKKLNNKGFAVSVILYTAVTLVILILLLILSILSTNTKVNDTIVDNIKEKVSSFEEQTQVGELGNLTITAEDNIASGQWHTNDVILSFSLDNRTDVTYYYGFNAYLVTNELNENTLTIKENIKDKIYYAKACQKDDPRICSNIGAYLLKIDKDDPEFEVEVEVDNVTAFKQIKITSTSSVSGISHYQYYITDAEEPIDPSPSEISTLEGNTAYITTPGNYIYIKAYDQAGKASNWKQINLNITAS
ncbi:MAG: hypothetical protein PUB18_05110 [bacterium]|nr:hypothetical protein [bacterium]